MTTFEIFRSTEDSRRQWRRVPVRTAVRCKRLGWSDAEMVLETVDLSPGGARLRAPEQLMAGDVVMCWIDSGSATSATALKALVVHAEPHDEETCEVHVAWTNVSAESAQGLEQLLALHDNEPPDAHTPLV